MLAAQRRVGRILKPIFSLPLWKQGKDGRAVWINNHVPPTTEQVTLLYTCNRRLVRVHTEPTSGNKPFHSRTWLSELYVRRPITMSNSNSRRVPWIDHVLVATVCLYVCVSTTTFESLDTESSFSELQMHIQKVRVKLIYEGHQVTIKTCEIPYSQHVQFSR